MSQPAARPVATIKDVARAAGVSASTVSYVLTGKRSISLKTTARVRQTMTELDYRPHAGARALANARTNVPGVPRNPGGVSCVDLDLQAAGRLAVDELADLGHTTIGFLGPTRAVIEWRTSYAGRLRHGVLSAAELRAVQVISHACHPSFAGLQSWIGTTLAIAPAMSALIVHNERLLGLLPAILAERGLSVPRDMSVVAVCRDDVAVQHSVSYSNIWLPADELGRAAVEMVVRRMTGAGTTETRLLSPSLTRRRSTSPR